MASFVLKSQKENWVNVVRLSWCSVELQGSSRVGTQDTLIIIIINVAYTPRI